MVPSSRKTSESMPCLQEEKVEIKLVTYLNEHWYKIFEGDQEFHIASVTTKLGIERKQFLERWRGEVGNKNADEKMYESQQKGKRIHHALHVYLSGGTVLYHPYEFSVYTDLEIEEIKSKSPLFFILKNQEEMIDLWKLQQWFDEVKPEIMNSELTVFDISEDMAGTLDLAIKIKEGVYFGGALEIPKTGLYIGDLKTGAQIDDSAWSQMAVYAFCYEKMGLGEVDGVLTFHTQGKAKKAIPGLSTPLKMKVELPFYLDIYKNLASVWKARNPNAGPKIFKFPSLIKRTA